MLRRALRRVPDIAWYLMLGLLPLTSFPLMSRLVGGAMVMPPAGLVLFLLVVAWLLPAVARGRTFPPQAKPLLVFVGVCVLSALLSFFLPIPPFKDENFSLHMLEAGLTLGVGVCMYLVVAVYPRDRRLLTRSLGWINASGFILIAWSLAQAFFWYTRHDYPDWMVTIQGYLSVTRLYPQRVTGLAFEPSWLAHQLNMLYLPLWMAASALRFSAHRVRLWFVTVEDLLLVGGLAVLVLSISRVGWLSALLMVCFLLLKANLGLIRWIRDQDQSAGRPGQRPGTDHWAAVRAAAGVWRALPGGRGRHLARRPAHGPALQPGHPARRRLLGLCQPAPVCGTGRILGDRLGSV